MVQFKPLFTALGLSISYEPNTKSVIGSNEKYEVVLGLGNNIAKVNGKEVKLDVAPKTIDGNTFVPLRFITQATGHNLYVDQNTKRIFIGIFWNYNKDKYFDVSWGMTKDEVEKMEKIESNERLGTTEDRLYYTTNIKLYSGITAIPGYRSYYFKNGTLSKLYINFKGSENFDSQYSIYNTVVYGGLNELYTFDSIDPGDELWDGGKTTADIYREVYENDSKRMYEMAIRSGDLKLVSPFKYGDTEMGVILSNNGSFSEPKYQVTILYYSNKENQPYQSDIKELSEPE